MNVEKQVWPAGAPNREAPLDMNVETFRTAGHEMVDRIAEFLASVPDRPVAPDTAPSIIRQHLGTNSLPERGDDAGRLLKEAADLLFDHSTLNGHPRFWGYITSSAAPIGMLAELLTAAVNPNVGAWALSPMATEIETQTVRWIAELIGYPVDCGGLLVSGGNMANIVAAAAARKARAPWDVRATGVHAGAQRLRIYASTETHTWLQKAADLLGLGTEAVRWISLDHTLRIDTTELRRQILADTEAGDLPFLLVGTAGTVSTGAIDPLPELAEICNEHGLWFHIDGAYGGFAAVVPDAPPDLLSIGKADSIAVDPHKWLYAPLEAGCVLVRDPHALRDAFSYHPPYYHFDEMEEEAPLNFYEYGPQNSRGFRALKVWLSLRQAGRSGYAAMIADDIRLAQALDHHVREHPELDPLTQNLSITTFRYVPAGLIPGSEQVDHYLNTLNEALLERLQRSGEAFISNAVIAGVFALRACIVNFRITPEDIAALPDIVARYGAKIDARLRPAELRTPH